MKFYNLTVLGLISLLASCAFARPRARVADDIEPIPQHSRMTAFVLTDSGVTVECWEIGDLLPEQQITRQDGSKGAVRRMHMGVGEGGLTGVDIITWPSYTTLYPPPPDASYKSNGFDFTLNPCSFTLKHGLIYIENSSPFPKSDADESQFFFDMQNGDDWIYFEDRTSVEDIKKASAPIKVESVSASETTIITFKYNKTPEHRVLHPGQCTFAGLTPATYAPKRDKDLELARLTVQEL